MRTRLSSLATPEVSCAKNPRGPSEHRHMTCGRGSDTQVAKASLIMSTLIASHLKGPRGHCTEFCQRLRRGPLPLVPDSVIEPEGCAASALASSAKCSFRIGHAALLHCHVQLRP